MHYENISFRMTIQKIWGNGYKWLLGRFHLHTRWKFLTTQTVIQIISPAKSWIPQHWKLLDSPGQGTGPSGLGSFAKKVWTRWFSRLLPTWNAKIFMRYTYSRIIFLLLHILKYQPWVWFALCKLELAIGVAWTRMFARIPRLMNLP